MNGKESYLNAEYGSWYEKAKNDEKRQYLYFDPRGWRNEDIKAFFEDLRFCDYEAYEKCLLMFPQRRQTSNKGVRRAENRYKRWLDQHNRPTE